MENEWIVDKKSTLGRIALKHRIYQYLTKHRVGLTATQMKRVVFINESYQPLSNPVLSTFKGEQFKRRFGL
jgi:hypothetical protein